MAILTHKFIIDELNKIKNSKWYDPNLNEKLTEFKKQTDDLRSMKKEIETVKIETNRLEKTGPNKKPKKGSKF